jgi:hypothetical protein
MTNQLRADATTFTPTFMTAPATFDDSFGQMATDIENEVNDAEVDELAVAMNDAVMANEAGGQVSSLPAHMKKHAAEFWFPDSRYESKEKRCECRNFVSHLSCSLLCFDQSFRDCTCCKGFKHGCSCQASNNGVCVCSANTK